MLHFHEKRVTDSVTDRKEMFKMANNTTITDEQVVERARVAVEIAIMKHKALGVPIVEYDRKTKKVYQVYNDGRRVEVSL